MKTCPKCGHRDTDCWLGSRWMGRVQYCRMEELKEQDHELYEILASITPRENKPHIIEPFIYAVTPSGYAWRMDTKDHEKQGSFRDPKVKS